MQNMFLNCVNIISLDLSSFDTSMVRDMTNMFNNCTSLFSLNISSFDVKSCSKFENIFENDVGLVLYINSDAYEKMKEAIPSYINISQEINYIELK